MSRIAPATPLPVASPATHITQAARHQRTRSGAFPIKLFICTSSTIRVSGPVISIVSEYRTVLAHSPAERAKTMWPVQRIPGIPLSPRLYEGSCAPCPRLKRYQDSNSAWSAAVPVSERSRIQNGVFHRVTPRGTGALFLSQEWRVFQVHHRQIMVPARGTLRGRLHHRWSISPCSNLRYSMMSHICAKYLQFSVCAVPPLIERLSSKLEPTLVANTIHSLSGVMAGCRAP